MSSSCRFKMSSFASFDKQSESYPSTRLASIMLTSFENNAAAEDSNG
jgi:hypothetical protein